jgi:hypothetical protein
MMAEMGDEPEESPSRATGCDFPRCLDETATLCARNELSPLWVANDGR